MLIERRGGSCGSGSCLVEVRWMLRACGASGWVGECAPQGFRFVPGTFTLNNC